MITLNPSADDQIAWFAEMVRRLAIDDNYDRTIVLHIPTAKKLVAAIERLQADLAKWEAGCTGKHGSQATCV